MSDFAERGSLRKSLVRRGWLSHGLLRGLGMVRGCHGWGDLLTTSPRSPLVLPDLDLDSSDSSLRSDDEDSILSLLAAPPPQSIRRLPRPRGPGVVRSPVSLPQALLQDSRPGVVASRRVHSGAPTGPPPSGPCCFHPLQGEW